MDATPGGSGSATVMSAEDRAALVSAIKANACIIVLGNTGCGKTTQLPQLLLQAGFGPVCVTQPRRVAAVAAARRVARERRVEVGTEVGFAIRFEQACDASTRIKFVTDGVLLREAVAQPALPQYGSLVLDEAHERSLNTDVLLSIAKRILAGLHSAAAGQPRPGPQRLVVSSATLDASRFALFFLGAPVVQVSSRSFPVAVHHVAKPITSDTARLEAALELAMRVHTQRPAGPNQDVLLFLAGQDDIATATHAARTLAAELSATRPGLPQLLVLPLHSSVASADQARVLARPPEHTRRLIVATNIAETSLTIPGVSVVIDTGVAKEKRYECDKGMEVLSVVPISRSSAVQRAGRAGRTGPGEVWRLYTEEQMAGFLQAPIPEIQRTNLATMVLSLKQMGVDKPEQLDWLDPPEPSALQQAMRQLFLLDALDRHSRLTPCGASMARLPLEPCLAKTMLCAVQSGCAPTAAAMCALVYGEDVFCRAGPEPLKQAAQEARKRYEAAEGDHTTLLNVFEEWATVAPTHREAWCSRHGLHARALRAASDVRAQLLSLLDKPPAAIPSQREGHWRVSPAGGTGADSDGNEEGRRPNGGGQSSPRTRRLCRQAICEGHFMHAARRAHASRAFVTLAEPAQTVFPRHGNEALLDTASHVVFSELAWHGRLVMRHACAVEPEWLQHLLPRLKEPMADSLGFRDGGAAQQAAGGMPRPAAAEAPSLVRRNDANAVAAAQQRFEQRRKRLKSERVG